MRQQEKTELARKEIRRAAMELFLEKGYEGSSVQEIAIVSGYSVGSVYRQWKSKRELYVELWHDYVSDYIREGIETAPENTTEEEMIDFLLARSRVFANARETRCLQAADRESMGAMSVDNMSDWAKEYQNMLYTFLKSIYPKANEQRLRTVAGVLHSILNADAMKQSQKSVPHYEFDEQVLRDCLLSVARTCEEKGLDLK